MKKKLLILAGGYSREREISIQTAKAVFNQIKKDYNCKILDPRNNFIVEIRKFKPNVIFNALHGRYGEDGYIQIILENEKIKYTHSGVKASSICINKLVSKKIFKTHKIISPSYLVFKPGSAENSKKIFKKINRTLKFPVVIKPINEGSSVGVFICNKNNFFKNLKKLNDEKEILIEKYIPGREIQVAIMGNRKLGTIELVPKRKFYDYKAKYDKQAKTTHILPVQLSKKKVQEVENIALKVHKITGCKGITRSDFRYSKNKFYLLEINTQPGMTELSLVPEIARYKGISFYKLIKWIINDASTNR